MFLLIIGLILFFVIKLSSLFPYLKNKMIAKVGKKTYLISAILISLIGLMVAIYGFTTMPMLFLWVPPSYSRMLAHAVMPFVFIIMMLGLLPTFLGYKLKRPLAIAMILWSGVHLIANAEVRTLILFGSFFVYGLLQLLFTPLKVRPKEVPGFINRYRWDLLAIILGLGLFPLIMLNHFRLFGMPA